IKKKQRLEGNEELYEIEEEPPEVKNDHQERLQALQRRMPWCICLHATYQPALQAGDGRMSISVVQRAVQELEGDGGAHYACA
ncbi:MAG: hypothetical protein EZS28_043115, partial [Streblomastix strix]